MSVSHYALTDFFFQLWFYPQQPQRLHQQGVSLPFFDTLSIIDQYWKTV